MNAGEVVYLIDDDFGVRQSISQFQSASVLGIAEVTLQVHRSQIMSKMDAGSFAELVRMAIKLGVPVAQLETSVRKRSV